MNWDAILWIALIILGAALIVGGFVAYRGSPRTGVRALAAASVAAGVVMLAIVAFTVPTSVETEATGQNMELSGSSGQ
jgi:drug/metabolite transporter (DMT)-like permease